MTSPVKTNAPASILRIDNAFHPKQTGEVGQNVQLSAVSLFAAASSEGIPPAKQVRPDEITVCNFCDVHFTKSTNIKHSKTLSLKHTKKTHFVEMTNKNVAYTFQNNYVIDIDDRKELGQEIKSKDVVTWTEFTESSTFHGVKYIFNSDYRSRRVAWVICVLAAIVLFVAQIASRSVDFFKYSTTVDVEVIYTDSVKFPAVTFCNQNNFR